MKTEHVTSYIQQLAQRLQERFQDQHLSEQYAWWTIETITKKSRGELLTQSLFTLTKEEKKSIDAWVHALVDLHEPIQYLIGWVPFLDLTINVKPPILIPRPETEEWCAEVIQQLLPYKNLPLQILDLCAGSGCIGLAFAQALPQAKVYAVDNAPHARALTSHNAKINNINNIACIDSDLFSNLHNMQFDLIVANPPYISEQEFVTLDTSVTNWEDKHALVAADDGYGLIKKIIEQAPYFIRPNNALKKANIPQLIIEHGATQAAYLVDLMHKAGYTHLQTHKDLAGKDRVVSGRLADEVLTKKR